MDFAYCGGQVLQWYVHKVKLIVVAKLVRAPGSDTCDPSGKARVLSLVDAVQWPVAQSVIYLCFRQSVILLQARREHPVVDDLLEANCVLRLLKLNKDIRLHF